MASFFLLSEPHFAYNDLHHYTFHSFYYSHMLLICTMDTAMKLKKDIVIAPIRNFLRVVTKPAYSKLIFNKIQNLM